jgi:polyisoprenoid-binding protein YceI
MFVRLAVLAVWASSAVGSAPETGRYLLSSSRFALEVDKTGLMRGKTHLFLFERLRGELRYDAAHPENSSVELVIDAASIVCKDTWVSGEDLKKIQGHAEQEMLAVKRYPEIRFVSSNITPHGDGKYLVEGDLTIRGLARPVTVRLQMKPQGSQIAFHGQAEVRMTAYKLKPPSAALGLIGTRDQMRVSFEMAARPAPLSGSSNR